jgi:hypothetical protein
MRATFVVLALATVTPTVVESVDPPPISDEIVLDHGYRYREYVDRSERCAIAVAGSACLR